MIQEIYCKYCEKAVRTYLENNRIYCNNCKHIIGCIVKESQTFTKSLLVDEIQTHTTKDSSLYFDFLTCRFVDKSLEQSFLNALIKHPRSKITFSLEWEE